MLSECFITNVTPLTSEQSCRVGQYHLVSCANRLLGGLAQSQPRHSVCFSGKTLQPLALWAGMGHSENLLWVREEYIKGP